MKQTRNLEDDNLFDGLRVKPIVQVCCSKLMPWSECQSHKSGNQFERTKKLEDRFHIKSDSRKVTVATLKIIDDTVRIKDTCKCMSGSSS